MNPGEEQQARERGTALTDLRQHWGEWYSIEWLAGEFWASRRDDGSSVHRLTAGELHDAILDDFVTRPVVIPC